jgi:small-conductance mechanosensitive channel
MGCGDSSINFELRAWTDQFKEWRQIRSDLAVAVYDAVYGAGMTFPFPQREVRVLHDPEAGASVSSQPQGRAEAAAGEGPAAARPPGGNEGGKS